MNCTVCHKPVDEHLEGRKTDRCIGKKLGWTRISLQGTHGNIHWQAWDEKGNIVDLPHYSSPDITPETWGLVEGFDKFFILKVNPKQWQVVFGGTDKEKYVNAPTAPLAICRAFLAKEGEDA